MDGHFVNPSEEGKEVNPSNQPDRMRDLGRSLNLAIRQYVNPKKLVMLSFFSLLAGNAVIFTMQYFVKAQLLGSTRSHHLKVFMAYEQAVERNRKLLSTAQQGLHLQQFVNNLNSTNPATHGSAAPANGAANHQVNQAQGSPWWMALQDLKKEFPSLKIRIIMPSQNLDPRDRRLLDNVASRPRGHSISDEKEGWAQSLFVLPTRNTAALSVTSYIRDDWNYWKECSVQIGLYTALLFMVFGWFWTRAETSGQGESTDRQKLAQDVAKKLSAISQVNQEMATLIQELRTSIQEVEEKSDLTNNPVLRNLEDVVSHLHLLAINGSIESVRSPESGRVFHSLLNEMNQLAMRSRRLISKLRTQDRDAFTRIDEKLNRFQETLKKAS